MFGVIIEPEMVMTCFMSQLVSNDMGAGTLSVVVFHFARFPVPFS